MKTLLLILIGSSLPLSADTLTAQPPVELTGTQGKFDFIKIDATHRRLLACHTGNGTLDILDLDSSKLVKSIPTGNAQGVAIDDKNGTYYVSASKPPQLAIVDSTKLEVTGRVPLPAPADLLAYHAASNRVFVDNDDKPEMWVVDPMANTIVSTVTFPGAGMEDLGFNTTGTYLYQCLKDSSELAQLDPSNLKILAHWPTAPSDKPHGMAILPDSDAALIAGSGKLSLISLTDGHLIASADIAQKVDEIAYDPGLHRAYCASGLGTISIVSVASDKLTTLENIPSSPGAHSIAVDPQTHTVWIAYAKDNKPFLQSFLVK